VAAGFVGCLDQACAELFERRGCCGGSGEEALDLFVRELAGEAVGAEEEEVAGFDFGFDEVGGDVSLGADGAGDDVAQGGAGGFGAGHAAEADLFFDEGVVLGAELDAAVAQAVAAAVADVEDPYAVLGFRLIRRQRGEQADQGGAHAAEAEVALGAGVDGFVGGDDGFFGDGGEGQRVVAVAVAIENVFVFYGMVGVLFGNSFRDQAEDFVDRERAGDFAGCGAAHAVTDDIDSMLDGVAKGIFIGGALAAAIGKGGGGIAHDSGSHEVLPANKSTTSAQELACAFRSAKGTKGGWTNLCGMGRCGAGLFGDRFWGSFRMLLSVARGW